MSCRDLRDWLHRDSSSLDEAQRLLLDDHLASCAECRGDRAHLRSLREVGRALPVPETGSHVYNRAIARALLGPRTELAPPKRPLWLIPIAIGVAAVVIAIVVTRDGEPRRAPEVVAPAPAPMPVPAPAPAPPPRNDIEEAPPAIRVATAECTKLRRSGNTFILDQGKVEIEASSDVRI